MTEVTREEFERLQNWYSELHVELDEARQFMLELIELQAAKASLACEAAICAAGEADADIVRAVADKASALAKAAPSKPDDEQDTKDANGKVKPARYPRNTVGALARIKDADAKLDGRMAEIGKVLRGHSKPQGKKAG